MLFTMASFVIVIAGGVGTYYGALVGGFLIGIVEELGSVTVLPASMKQVLSFALLMVILFFKPQGLFGKRSE